jgi:hypothetical protein
MKVGQCVHLVSDFICTEGKHQNYPCPYRDNISKCSCSMTVTTEMAEQFNNNGVCICYEGRCEDEEF